jgi:hypothetical protein
MAVPARAPGALPAGFPARLPEEARRVRDRQEPGRPVAAAAAARRPAEPAPGSAVRHGAAPARPRGQVVRARYARPAAALARGPGAGRAPIRGWRSAALAAASAARGAARGEARGPRRRAGAALSERRRRALRAGPDAGRPEARRAPDAGRLGERHGADRPEPGVLRRGRAARLADAGAAAGRAGRPREPGPGRSGLVPAPAPLPGRLGRASVQAGWCRGGASFWCAS